MPNRLSVLTGCLLALALLAPLKSGAEEIILSGPPYGKVRRSWSSPRHNLLLA